METELRNRQGLTEKDFLAQYDANKYERPSNTVDMLIFTVLDNKLKLLMVKRADHPCIGQWALPGGFVNIDESLDSAAERELKEETSLDNIYMEQVYTWGDIGRDPRTRIISTTYMALVDSKDLKVKADDDAEDADWFTVDCQLVSQIKHETMFDLDYRLVLSSARQNLSAVVRVKKIFEGRTIKTVRTILEVDNIAVDHAKIIQQAIEVLKDKIENTAIIFNLMPNEFTIDEFKHVYEIVSDTKFSDETLKRFSSMLHLENSKYKYKEMSL